MRASVLWNFEGDYCWFSLTWSTAMFFNENKRKRLHNNRVKFPEDLVGAPTWPPFLCLGHQHGGRDVMWKPRIVCPQSTVSNEFSIRPFPSSCLPPLQSECKYFIINTWMKTNSVGCLYNRHPNRIKTSRVSFSSYTLFQNGRHLNILLFLFK